MTQIDGRVEKMKCSNNDLGQYGNMHVHTVMIPRHHDTVYIRLCEVCLRGQMGIRTRTCGDVTRVLQGHLSIFILQLVICSCVI